MPKNGDRVTLRYRDGNSYDGFVVERTAEGEYIIQFNGMESPYEFGFTSDEFRVVLLRVRFYKVIIIRADEGLIVFGVPRPPAPPRFQKKIPQSVVFGVIFFENFRIFLKNI